MVPSTLSREMRAVRKRKKDVPMSGVLRLIVGARGGIGGGTKATNKEERMGRVSRSGGKREKRKHRREYSTLPLIWGAGDKQKGEVGEG